MNFFRTALNIKRVRMPNNKGTILEAVIKEAKLETVSVTPMGENLACEVGKYELKIQPEGAGVLTDKGKYMMLWKLEDGIWKWDTDAWNTSLPPP